MHEIDGGTAAVVSGSAAAASTALSLAQQVSSALFGVTLAVVLAGFAGAFYGLMYREPMPAARLWSNLVACTILASTSAPALGQYLGISAIGTGGMSGLIGFLLVAGQPWLKNNLSRLFDIFSRFLDRLIGKSPPPGGEG